MKYPLEERIQEDLIHHFFDSKFALSITTEAVSALKTQRSLREANNSHEPYSVIYTH